jgi:hypothetical protein
MSRSIAIGFRSDAKCASTRIEVRPPYFLLGTQETSKRFWSIPKLKELGITQLSELGVLDPVCFIGWEMIGDLHREITLLQNNLSDIEFDPEIKAQWLSHLVYCYHLLIATAPRRSIPEFEIG